MERVISELNTLQKQINALKIANSQLPTANRQMPNNPYEIQIIFETEDLVAINKPHGLLVHRSKIADDVKIFALQLLRDTIGQKVYLVHRLDRKTSGVLLFAKSKEVCASIQKMFSERTVEKTYTAIVRGFTPETNTIDYPLTQGTKIKEAITAYKTIQQYELGIPLGKFQTSRYSMIEIKPRTGRFHQIRKHMAHIRHPIIGDRPHGCNKQNRMWKERFGMVTMLLHAQSLQFNFPENNPVKIIAPLSRDFRYVLNLLNDTDLIRRRRN